MRKIQIKHGAQFRDYLAYGALTFMVKQFQEDVDEYVNTLKDTTIWMVNSTAIGGGVAEMLPSQMRILRELGLKIEWLVIEADDQHFFEVTKNIHNAIHGSGAGQFTEEDKEVYERVNEENLDKALSFIKDGDIVVIHDPQPMPLGAHIRKHRDVRLVWRCHIGLNEENDTTRSVWDFLSNYTDSYDHFVFSLIEYVPEVLSDRSIIITPAIDPLSHKNRMLQIHKCIGILHQSGVINDRDPILYPFYEHGVRRVMPDGSFNEVNHHSKLDLVYRPVVTQISRWDRLKGFKELMDAFIHMKRENENRDPDTLAYRRIQKSRLVLAGPDPKYVSDDPEGMEVLEELTREYKSIPAALQDDIAILLLPLDNPKENALIVNALQFSSSIVVQNSIQEGFGLTATEAMWKKTPVLVSGAAGLVHQVIDNQTGKVNHDPSDIVSLSESLDLMLNNPKERDKWAFNGQVRVIENFTLFTQLKDWLELLARL